MLIYALHKLFITECVPVGWRLYTRCTMCTNRRSFAAADNGEREWTVCNRVILIVTCASHPRMCMEKIAIKCCTKYALCPAHSNHTHAPHRIRHLTAVAVSFRCRQHAARPSNLLLAQAAWKWIVGVGSGWLNWLTGCVLSSFRIHNNIQFDWCRWHRNLVKRQNISSHPLVSVFIYSLVEHCRCLEAPCVHKHIIHKC